MELLDYNSLSIITNDFLYTMKSKDNSKDVDYYFQSNIDKFHVLPVFIFRRVLKAMDFELFSFIDVNFVPRNSDTGVICAVQYQKVVLSLLKNISICIH